MATRSYTVTKEGFIANTYYRVGDTLPMHERAAKYLVLGEQVMLTSDFENKKAAKRAPVVTQAPSPKVAAVNSEADAVSK